MRNICRVVMISLFLGCLPNIADAQQAIEDCFNYRNSGDYQKAIGFGKTAIRISSKIWDSHYCLADAYMHVGELKLALREMKVAEGLAKSRNNLMVTYSGLGVIYSYMGDYDNSLLYDNRYLALAKEVADRDEEAKALNNIAGSYKKKGDIDKALTYYEESLRIATKEKNKADTYNNIAIAYSVKGDYEKKIFYLQKAVEIAERYGDYYKTAHFMLNLGNAYREIGAFDKAEEYLNEGLKKILKLGDSSGEAHAYKYIGWLFYEKDDIQKARDCLTKAYHIFSAIGAKESARNVKDFLDKNLKL